MSGRLRLIENVLLSKTISATISYDISKNKTPIWVNSVVALTATIYVFTVRLADADRGVYETLNLRLARHPSETAEYLLTRLLAYCLEFAEGISFSRGLSEPDEPAIAVRDLTGVLQTWIDIGTFTGSIGVFFAGFLLFMRFLPVVAMSEVKGIMAQADPHRAEAAAERATPVGAAGESV